MARRRGEPDQPDPIFSEVTVKKLDGGGFEVDVSKPIRPLRREYGGAEHDADGATRFLIPHSEGAHDTPELRAAVARLKAQMAAYESRNKRKAAVKR